MADIFALRGHVIWLINTTSAGWFSEDYMHYQKNIKRMKNEWGVVFISPNSDACHA